LEQNYNEASVGRQFRDRHLCV